MTCARALAGLAAAITVSLAGLGLTLPATSPAAVRPLRIGFFDENFTGPAAATWLARSAGAGADIVRIDIGWPAPDTRRRPPGFNARNPADPHYDFTRADAAIKQATANGLQVIAAFTGAPTWASGPRRPGGADPHTWRPDPRALGDYAVALGRRYSGRYPDPSNPLRALPRVTAFQVWNEPNLSKYLNPQWSGNDTASPGIYRAMLNAFYAGLKSVDPSALVVTAGTAPFGDPEPGGERIMPARFVRDLLCVRQTSRGLRGTGCRDPALFDALAHHPYSVGAPNTIALNPDDASIPDLGKLGRILRVAERTGGALPHRRHSLWVTETGYNTRPPNPAGVPVGQDARWLEWTLRLLWSEGVDVVTWRSIVDQPPAPDYASSAQSGIYFITGRPKPAMTAFRFPFVVFRERGGRGSAWGRAPSAGTIVIERHTKGGWVTVQELHVALHEVFTTSIPVGRGATLRAVIGGLASLSWSVT